MLKSYKKRFVIMTMSLIGVILTVVFAAVGVYICNDSYHSLQNMMEQVLRPWNTVGIDALVSPERPDDFETEDDDHYINEPDNNDFIDDKTKHAEAKYNDYEFASFIFDSDSDVITTVSDSDFINDDDVEKIISSVIKSENKFGKLKDYSLYFCKEQIFKSNTYKIALCDTSSYTSTVIKDVSFLLVMYLVLMLGFLIISKKLSTIASKPMEDAIEIEKQFVTDVSHDLKTPITVILANNSIIKSSPDTSVSEQMQWINSTDTAARNMLEMINEMLTFSSLEAEKPNQKLEKVNASSLAEKCVLQFESVAYDRGIEFLSEIDDSVYINSTNDYTQRIFNSIIENAFKYENNGGKIVINLKREKKKAVFTVQNFGSFISQEDLPHIFERFYRADKTRNEQKGHGLGLPIVMQITNLIGAKISAESTRESGTKFTVAFDLNEK